jgi:nucleotide-binding universal stress UspA family protein
MIHPEILVTGTLTTAGNNAARRAALLARQHGCALRVLHVERDAKQLPAAQAGVEQLCGQLRGRLGIRATAEVLAGDLLKHLVQHTRESNLVVMGSSHDNPLMGKIAGVPVDRLIRLCRTPTLIVKRNVDAAFAQGPAEARSDGRYARVLACVDLEPVAQATITAAKDIAPGAQLEAFHAVDSNARQVRRAAQGLLASSNALGQARSAVGNLLVEAGADAAGACVGFGDPADAVLGRQRAIGADLVVIGKRQRGLLADFFLGNVTRHILAAGTADVLVLPRHG